MNEDSTWGESKSIVAKILKGENRFCEEVTITRVNGECPYGHRAGQKYRVTALNSDGLCGSLFKTIHASIVTLHYGGSLLWEKQADAFTGVCPEMGKVEVESKRIEQTRPVRIKTRPDPKDMTGKGFSTLDKYRVVVEVLDIANRCYWGHRVGDTFEVDPFNVGKACGFLYSQLYPFIAVLLAGATPAWATQEHSVTAVCPDTYDQLAFRLYLEER
ncbi:MAG: TIGR04076 family protein [Deltaproteobacteria bacterium]|jgi:uncharacterized repeat protein (TIGR04076 family)|nr:TIGR04076 family protein [Deltaproteobacteria bacterium]MBW2552952.1 TIGR04076 family protein [Deltaproteobacteria bacterium]